MERFYRTCDSSQIAFAVEDRRAPLGTQRQDDDDSRESEWRPLGSYPKGPCALKVTGKQALITLIRSLHALHSPRIGKVIFFFLSYSLTSVTPLVPVSVDLRLMLILAW